jgi:hypothetical protein
MLVTMAPLAVIVIGLLKLIRYIWRSRGVMMMIDEVDAERFEVIPFYEPRKKDLTDRANGGTIDGSTAANIDARKYRD